MSARVAGSDSRKSPPMAKAYVQGGALQEMVTHDIISILVGAATIEAALHARR